MTTEKTKKPVIPTDLAMVLRPAQNGGWIIESVRESHMMPSLLGAFTTPAEMLAALHEAFYPADERREMVEFAMEMAKMSPPAPMVITKSMFPSAVEEARDGK